MSIKNKPLAINTTIMKNTSQQNLTKRLGVWALVVAAILMIPLVAMQFTSEVNWTGSDFVFGAVVLFGFATIYELIANKLTTSSQRITLGLVVFLVFAFVWVGAATGFEGVIDRL